MILTAICALVILGVAFAWGSKARGYGFFSALITLGCVLVAGAIAFGFWETVVHNALFKLAEHDGFFGRVAMDNAWGIGLLLPFVVSLFVLRMLADRLVPGNLDMSDTVNFVGGSLVGILAGSVTMGIVVVSLGHMRTGQGLFGYQSITDDRGNMQYTSPLWVPVDLAVIKLYEGMSVGSFATGTPLTAAALAVALDALLSSAAALRFARTLAERYTMQGKCMKLDKKKKRIHFTRKALTFGRLLLFDA